LRRHQTDNVIKLTYPAVGSARWLTSDSTSLHYKNWLLANTESAAGAVNESENKSLCCFYATRRMLQATADAYSISEAPRRRVGDRDGVKPRCSTDAAARVPYLRRVQAAKRYGK